MNTQKAVKQELETVIGLEVHLQLSTKTKIFCGCANEFGRPPNTLTCPVCLGLPGSLPVFNRQALEFAIKVALGINAKVNPLIKFDRKNYYYPDLPKGYQISQYDMPIANDGQVVISLEGGTKTIRIKRAHLEEDAGKLIHAPENNCSLVDYNRTGTPLLEIVTEPDLCCAQEAYDYLLTLKLILQYLNVSDCDMEKGSLRCDANISVREKGSSVLGTKTEVKNLNSFKAVKMALEFEETRQKQMVAEGERIIQETRLWNEQKGLTLPLRSKEEAHDYRYFPEPDLVPFLVAPETVENIRKSLPELPAKKLERFLKDYRISEYDAGILIQDPGLADFFERCASHYADRKKICNWLIGPLRQELNSRKAACNDIRLSPEHLTGLMTKVEEGLISNLVGKEVLTVMIDTGKTAGDIIREKGLAQVSDETMLEKIIEQVVAENPAVIEQIKQGKGSAVGFLIGQAMKKTQGKANPKKMGEMIKRRLLND